MLSGLISYITQNVDMIYPSVNENWLDSNSSKMIWTYPESRNISDIKYILEGVIRKVLLMSLFSYPMCSRKVRFCQLFSIFFPFFSIFPFSLLILEWKIPFTLSRIHSVAFDCSSSEPCSMFSNTKFVINCLKRQFSSALATKKMQQTSTFHF